MSFKINQQAFPIFLELFSSLPFSPSPLCHMMVHSSGMLPDEEIKFYSPLPTHPPHHHYTHCRNTQVGWAAKTDLQLIRWGSICVIFVISPSGLKPFTVFLAWHEDREEIMHTCLVHTVRVFSHTHADAQTAVKETSALLMDDEGFTKLLIYWWSLLSFIDHL